MTSEVTRALKELESGRQQAAEELLPLIYNELRQLAVNRLRHERPDHTLQATALVHEAYLRLVSPDETTTWDSRHHFFGAAAEAMRRILIESARAKAAEKRGGGWQRTNLEPHEIVDMDSPADLLELDEALSGLEAEDAQAAMLVKLRYFSGLTVPQAADVLGISLRSTERLWTFAKAWLYRALH